MAQRHANGHLAYWQIIVKCLYIGPSHNFKSNPLKYFDISVLQKQILYHKYVFLSKLLDRNYFSDIIKTLLQYPYLKWPNLT
jgi:hypothetical protein